MIGGGKDGLPIILGNVDTPAGTATPPRKDAVPPPPPATETVPGAYAPPQAVPRAFAPQALPREFSPQAAPNVPAPIVTPPGVPPATTVIVQPGAAVNVNAQPSASPQTPPGPGENPAVQEPGAANRPGAKPQTTEKPAIFNPFDLTSYESVLSRITGGSRPTGTQSGAEAPAKPAAEKQ